MDPATAANEVVHWAQALEAGPDCPAGYVERARAAAAALTPVEVEDDPVAAAAHELTRAAGAAVDPQRAARSPVGRMASRPVGRLIGWYLGFLLPPAADLGRAAARHGVAVAGRLDRVEVRRVARRAAREDEVRALGARVAKLEQR